MQRRRSARIDLLLLSTVVLVALFSTGEVDCSHTPCTTNGACCYTAYRTATRYVLTSTRTRDGSYDCNCEDEWWGGESCDTCYRYRTEYRSRSETYTQSYTQYSCCSGYSGNPCIDINECSSSNGGCQHNCNNTVGSYYCTCDSGWELSSNGKTCTDINECSSNNGGCQHNCYNTVGSYYCTCNTGWVLSSNGQTCTDAIECSSSINGGCDQNCYNTVGSYYCTCNTGWVLASNGQTCTDTNECSSNKGGCQHNCYNTAGSYYCTCNTGWALSSNGNACTDINECSSNKGGCQHNCYNTVGSYYCTCNTGWELSSNGNTCTDINECYSNNGGCDQNCHNTVGSYYCSCNSGWTLSWNSKACADVNECASNHGCQHNCHNTAGSYYCTCNTGWVLSSNDQTCTVTIEVTTTQDTYVLTDGGTAVVNCSATGGVAPTNMTFHTPTGVLLTDTGSHGPGDRFYLGSTTLTQLNTSDSPLYQAWHTLTISGAAFEDSGTYTCSAANGTVEDTAGFDIFVEGIIEVSDAVIVKYNQTAEMECLALVFSTESSTVTWWWREGTGNSTQVVSEGGTVISTEVLGPDQLKSVLSIEVVDTTHDGVYVCVVSTGYNKLTADLLLLLEKEHPHTPVNLTASGIGPTWLTLEWTAIFVEHKPIEKYIIAQKSSSAYDRNITLENDKQGMPSLSIRHNISSDILPFTNYSFSVRACNHIGCSDESKPVLVTTPQDLPTEPLSFTLVETQSTSVSLQWKEPAMPNGIIVHYHIDYKPIASRSGIDYTASGVEARNCTGQILHSIPASVDTGPVLEWSLDRLLKATKYSFSIAATTEVGKGSTYSISVWTYDDVPEASPMEVTGESTTSSSITLSWEPPPANCQNGEITGYQIRFTNQPVLSPEEWSTQDVSGTAVDATIEGLEIFTEYFICIAARTSVDEYGPCSQPVNITTLTKSEFFNAVTIGSIGGGTAGLLVLLILVTACIAAAVKYQRKKLSQVQRKSCQNNELNVDMSNDAQGEKKSCQDAIYNEIKVRDDGMSHEFQDLPCHSNPLYGESLQLARTGTSKWMDNIYEVPDAVA